MHRPTPQETPIQKLKKLRWRNQIDHCVEGVGGEGYHYDDWWFHDPRPLWGNNIMMLVGIDLPHRPQKGEGGNII